MHASDQDTLAKKQVRLSSTLIFADERRHYPFYDVRNMTGVGSLFVLVLRHVVLRAPAVVAAPAALLYRRPTSASNTPGGDHQERPQRARQETSPTGNSQAGFPLRIQEHGQNASPHLLTGFKVTALYCFPAMIPHTLRGFGVWVIGRACMLAANTCRIQLC